MLIKYNKPNLRGFGELLTLKPGVNDVDPKIWQACVEKFGGNLQRLLDDGLVEVIEDKGEPVEASGLVKLNERKALSLVRETVDDKLLMLWHDGEKRKAVVAAIESQLEKLARAGEPEKKGG